MNLPEFFLRVKITDWDSCWLWMMFTNDDGYGIFGDSDGTHYAHRVVYILVYGEIPVDKEIHHICLNSSCVNPRHLVATRRINHPDSGASRNRNKTHCAVGHEYTPENTRFAVSIRNRKSTYRICKTCDKLRHKKLP